AGRQARGERDEHVLDRRRAVVVGGKKLGVVGVVVKDLVARLLGAEAVKPLHGRAAVRAVDPVAGRAPLEAGGVGRLRELRARGKQGFDVDAVVDLDRGDLHVAVSSSLRWCRLEAGTLTTMRRAR